MIFREDLFLYNCLQADGHAAALSHAAGRQPEGAIPPGQVPVPGREEWDPQAEQRSKVIGNVDLADQGRSLVRVWFTFGWFTWPKSETKHQVRKQRGQQVSCVFGVLLTFTFHYNRVAFDHDRDQIF